MLDKYAFGVWTCPELHFDIYAVVYLHCSIDLTSCQHFGTWLPMKLSKLVQVDAGDDISQSELPEKNKA